MWGCWVRLTHYTLIVGGPKTKRIFQIRPAIRKSQNSEKLLPTGNFWRHCLTLAYSLGYTYLTAACNAYDATVPTTSKKEAVYILFIEIKGRDSLCASVQRCSALEANGDAVQLLGLERILVDNEDNLERLSLRIMILCAFGACLYSKLVVRTRAVCTAFAHERLNFHKTITKFPTIGS